MKLLPTGLAALAMLAAGSAHAAGDDVAAKPQGGAEAGLLTCQSVEGTRLNLLVHSEVDVRCVFETTTGKVEHYTGETGIGLGLDLNWDRDERISFTVVSAGSDIRAGEHSLAGKYAGAKASVTAGVGVGAAALVGGSDDNIALQPIALEESTGLGIAGGLTYLILEPARAVD